VPGSGRGGRWGCDAVEGALLEPEIGVEVDVRGSFLLVVAGTCPQMSPRRSPAAGGTPDHGRAPMPAKKFTEQERQARREADRQRTR